VEIAEVVSLASAVAAVDPRPDDMQTWQAGHADKWIHARHYYRLLYAYAHHARPAVMVELGTDYGYGAWHLACGNPDGQVIAVDVDLSRVEKSGTNMVFWQADSLEAAEQVTAIAGGPIDLLIVDSLHTHEHAAAEFKLYDRLCAPGALQCFDDILYPREMRDFWDNLPGPKEKLTHLHPTWSHSGPPGFGVRVKP